MRRGIGFDDVVRGARRRAASWAASRIGRTAQGPFTLLACRTGRGWRPRPARGRRRPAPRVLALWSGPDRVAARLRTPVVPAIRLRSAGGVLRCHGVYPGTLISASDLETFPEMIFPFLRLMKLKFGSCRMPNCSASLAITAGFAACATALLSVCS